MANQFDGKDGNGYQPLPCAKADEAVPPKTGCPKSARIAELENMVRRLVRQHLPVEELEGMPGWSEVQDALKLNVRISELERHKVRLESEAMCQAASYREALEEIQRLKGKLAAERDLHMHTALHNNGKFERLRAELEACRKDAERLRGKLLEAADCIGEWGAYASEYFQDKHNLAGDIAEFQAAAMKEASSDASS